MCEVCDEKATCFDVPSSHLPAPSKISPPAGDKVLDLLSKMNGIPITKKEWEASSEYAQKDLKRKCLIVTSEVLAAINSPLMFEYWTEVENIIKAL